MRIVTRPDFDGVVCAVLLHDAVSVTAPVQWVEPEIIQKNEFQILSKDIIANLPFHENCALWFDHHFSNHPAREFKGLYKIAPSAARVVYEYYQGSFNRNYDELVQKADKIDAAQLTPHEIIHPETDDYLLLSMSINGRRSEDESYWNHMIDLLRRHDSIRDVMTDDRVVEKCSRVTEQNRIYQEYILQHTRMEGGVSVTDFRGMHPVPRGNRFLVYSLFPESYVNMKVRYTDESQSAIAVSVGHSIINPVCNVNVGLMLAAFEGGGHRGAGACSFDASRADQNISAILNMLMQNTDNET